MNRLTRHDPELVSRISGYAEIIAFRNVLIHGYAVISYQRVWEHVQVHLPVLRQEVEALLDELET